jgi:hypothetical protein
MSLGATMPSIHGWRLAPDATLGEEAVLGAQNFTRFLSFLVL